ncbi:MAG: hypothetical protein J6U05_02900 [Neisseriaceae bacterium]|nr:hypothetical protein [Neisseriaceae bacterium]
MSSEALCQACGLTVFDLDNVSSIFNFTSFAPLRFRLPETYLNISKT